MKLHNYAILNESLRSAREKYLDTNKLPKVIFDKLVDLDFTKTKKYLEWLCKIYSSDNNVFEEVEISGMVDLLHKFDKATKTKYKLPSKDINSYQTIESVIEALNDFDVYLDNSRLAKKHKGAEKIFENDNCILYHITTRQACMLYGSHTKWCITEKDNKDYWEDYTQENLFFFLIDKEYPEYKYAFAIPHNYTRTNLLNDYESSIQVFDATDEEVDPKVILDEYFIPVSTLNRLITKFLNIKRKSYLKHLLDKQILTPVDINGETYYDINSSLGFSSLTLLIENNKFKIKFNNCKGTFNCSSLKLDNLEGAPRKVQGNFDCSLCRLKSLKGAPEIVSGMFNCNHNPITSLQGGPKEVKNLYFCLNTNITNLVGSPEKWGSIKHQFMFIANNCKNLTSLEGCPEEVYGKVDFSYNKNLVSLKGGPKRVHGSYIVNHCSNLYSLKGAPEFIGPFFTEQDNGIFDCSRTDIKTLVGLPDTPDCNYSLNLSRLSLASLRGLPTSFVNPRQKLEIFYFSTYVKDVPIEKVFKNSSELNKLYYLILAY